MGVHERSDLHCAVATVYSRRIRSHMSSRRLLETIVMIVTVSVVTCSHPGPNGTTPQTSSPGLSKPKADKPVLAGLIKNVSLYPVPGRSNDLAISLVVSIRNSGGPDRPDGWKLEVNSPTAGVPTGLEPVHINGVVELPGSNKSVDLAKEDLTVKAADAIGRDLQVEGVLTFVLPATEERALNHNSSNLILHFKDSQGNSYQTPKTYIGKKVAQSSY
jgi:hypothetical protein